MTYRPYRYNGLDIRYGVIDNEKCLVVKDICTVAGLGRPTKVAKHLNPEHYYKSKIVFPGYSTQIMLVVNKTGLQELINRCSHNKIRGFKTWLHDRGFLPVEQNPVTSAD
jgi:prophage antirepressor-like protein